MINETRRPAIMLQHKADCECGESNEVLAITVLHKDYMICPVCKAHVYFEEWLYEEALNITEDLLNKGLQP